MTQASAGPAAGSVRLVAEDPATRSLLELARRVAAADITVTLTGESGAGKEVFARFIHQESRRRDGPLVAVNCAAIPESMLEAMLFGHEKGAFTGASEFHRGKFEQADGGTLLLDEITEMPLGLQAKLLRVLQEREIERLGGTTTLAVDVRVIAMSNRDLRQAVAEDILREDIYYRLNVFPLVVPPLRDRPADILPLAEHLLKRYAGGQRPAPGLSIEAGERLQAHRWPGNVRELDNVLQRALILRSGVDIALADLRIEESLDDLAGDDGQSGLRSSLIASEGTLILDALRAANGKRKDAAESLGISPRTLRYKLARLREHGVTLP